MFRLANRLNLLLQRLETPLGALQPSAPFPRVVRKPAGQTAVSSCHVDPRQHMGIVLTLTWASLGPEPLLLSKCPFLD